MKQSETELHQSIEQQLNFEELLLEISAHFINLPGNSINDAIEDAQRRICNCLNIDMSVLWQWSEKDPHFITITHLYSPPDGPERPIDIDGSKTFPWIYKKVLSGEMLAFSTSQLPKEAHIDKETRELYGAKSSVAIPLMTGGEPILGILTFDTIYVERSWSNNEVARFRIVAEIFTNALARKRSEKKQKETEIKLSLAADSADAGLWEFDCATSLFWSTERARKIFNYQPEDIISMESFEKIIYPEDLIIVQKALADSFKLHQKLYVEYRITSGASGPKWICSKGSPFFAQDGSPKRMLGVSIDISDRKQLEDDLQHNLKEVQTLKQQLEIENHYLREDLKTELGFEHVIGQSKEFNSVLVSARQVASTPATVLLLGETGTGKGVIANAIHQMSNRQALPFITVNCATLPHHLIESELFGRSKGAFTGADAAQAGRFEVANNGTIFLDEIGEMDLEMQAKLLRVLQEGEFERLGSPITIKVDTRVIAATGRNLRDEVENGRFREDLFYRLNVFPITIPPLRERKDDIPLLAQHFVTKYNRRMGKQIDRIARRTLEQMENYPWPGNVRELEHLIERGVILSSGTTLTISDPLLSEPITAPCNGLTKDLASNEREHIQNILNQTNWKIEGPAGAATILNIHPSTLRFRLKKLGIKRPA
jgi:formate hydrogenlyase transcriptional activator